MINSVSISTESFLKKFTRKFNFKHSKKRTFRTNCFVYFKRNLRNKNINLKFICTHNNVRSQLSQVWSNFATHYFKLKNIKSYFGGTSVTSFYRSAVKTLRKSWVYFSNIRIFTSKHRIFNQLQKLH